MPSAGPVSFVTALGEFVSRAAGGESAALVTGCAALETDASTVQTHQRARLMVSPWFVLRLIFPYRVSLSGVCQPADAEAVVTVDTDQPVGKTEVQSVTVTRGQNSTHPKRTNVLPKQQQPLKGITSVSSPVSSPLISFVLIFSFSFFSSSLFS